MIGVDAPSSRRLAILLYESDEPTNGVPPAPGALCAAKMDSSLAGVGGMVPRI